MLMLLITPPLINQCNQCNNLVMLTGNQQKQLKTAPHTNTVIIVALFVCISLKALLIEDKPFSI